VKLIIDARLPPSFVSALRDAGCDAVAAREIGLREAKDSVIWQYALENHAAILTKGEDFCRPMTFQCKSSSRGLDAYWQCH